MAAQYSVALVQQNLRPIWELLVRIQAPPLLSQLPAVVLSGRWQLMTQGREALALLWRILALPYPALVVADTGK